MARPISFNKRENEKKKAAKRVEKQKRKDERKSGAPGGAFEDMIAYVDAYGVISDTPPDAEKKEVINAEDIAVSVPKKEDSDEDPGIRGRVEYFNVEKGYGFIKEIASTEKYFFHISNAPADIAEGKIVLFETERGTRGLNAVRIRMESAVAVPDKA